MFRQAAKKIAHNSTLPVLGGNKDLRTLQDLITAEKAVLHSLQRLGTDIAKASEALKTWGMGEGDDLGDTLSASCALYLHFADALQAFANHEVTVREQMKSIRTREERLDEQRRRRKSLSSEADNAERKLSKMGPDNKNLQGQMDHLNKLREEIRIMDTDIMAEEASLGDYKRSTAKAWLSIKFGGLLECCEKGIIIGEHGKVVIAEIPLGRTEPGLPRAYYSGHSNTENLVTDARRALSAVAFSPEPNLGGLIHPAQYEGSDVTSLPPHNGFGGSVLGDVSRRTSVIMPMPTGDTSYADSASLSGQMPRSPFAGTFGSQLPPGSPYMTTGAQSLSYIDGSPPAPPPPDPAEFGVVASQEPYGPRASSMRSPEERERLMGPRSSRFSTVPALGGPRPPPGAGPGARDSQIYGGDRPPSLDVQRPQDDFSTSIAQALGDKFAFEGGEGGAGAGASGAGAKRESGSSRRMSHSSPPPVYSSIAGHDAEDDVQLAYVSHPEDEVERSPERRHREDRKVKFEGSSNAYNENASGSGPGVEQAAHDDDGRRSIGKSGHSDAAQSSLSEIPPVGETAPEPIQDAPPRIPSPPPPAPSSESTPHSDERSLDAEAAREVSREIDALMSSPAMTSPIPDSEPGLRTPSPLVPPQAPFARRATSPRPGSEIATSAPSSPRITTGGGAQFGGYMRERDRSLASPTASLSQSSADDREPTSPGSTRSRQSAEAPVPTPATAMPAISLHRPSPSPSAFSVNTNLSSYRATPQSEYASPLASPLPTPTVPFYSLPAASGSGKISAAAFRRQARSPSIPVAPSPGGGGDAPSVDTGPLMVKKRPLPTSPSGNATPGALRQSIPRVPSAPYGSRGSLDAPEGSGRFRSVSAAQPPGDRSSRAEGASDDDYDYISAYTGPEGRDASGYEQGRYATNLEQNGGLR